jgi:hypothetical protein
MADNKALTPTPLLRSALSDEIALDAARHPEDVVWYPV